MCVEWTNKKMGMAVGSLFVQDHFNHESKVVALEMIHGIREGDCACSVLVPLFSKTLHLHKLTLSFSYNFSLMDAYTHTVLKGTVLLPVFTKHVFSTLL
jgi:hypothetical protein